MTFDLCCSTCGYLMAFDFWAMKYVCVYGNDAFHQTQEVKEKNQ